MSFSFSSLPFPPHGDTHFSRDTPTRRTLSRPPTTIFTGSEPPRRGFSSTGKVIRCCAFPSPKSPLPGPYPLSCRWRRFLLLLQCLVCLPVCLTCRKKICCFQKQSHHPWSSSSLSSSPSSFPSSSSLVSLLLSSALHTYYCCAAKFLSVAKHFVRFGRVTESPLLRPACSGPRCVHYTALRCATYRCHHPSHLDSARPAAAPSLAQQLHSVIRPSPCFSATLSTPTPRSMIPLSADTAAHTPWSIIFPYPRPRVPPIVPKTKAQTRQG